MLTLHLKFKNGPTTIKNVKHVPTQTVLYYKPKRNGTEYKFRLVKKTWPSDGVAVFYYEEM